MRDMLQKAPLWHIKNILPCFIREQGAIFVYIFQGYGSNETLLDIAFNYTKKSDIIASKNYLDS